MAGDAPADKRVLAMRSIDTKFVMHWISGDWDRTAHSRSHDFGAQRVASDSSMLCSGTLLFGWFGYESDYGSELL